MADKIFINYRRDDSIGMAGRLHDRLAQTFGRAKLFMDVDHIPVGEDFVAHLNSQVTACDVVLVVIGPNWLGAKDESGRRRLDNPDDFVAIEIAAALGRNIRVIPVLVDGARMPKESELPDSLKPLARRQAAEVRHAHFGHDADALIARMRRALAAEATALGGWRVRVAIGVAAIAVLLLIGWGGYGFFRHSVERGVQQAALKWEEERTTLVAEANRKVEEAARVEQERQARAAAEAEAKRKADEAERQRLATVKAEQERQARAAEAEEKRKADEAERQRQANIRAEQEERERQTKAEQQRQANIRAEQERQARAAAEAEAKRKADEAEQQRQAAIRAEQERQARAAVDSKEPIKIGFSMALTGPLAPNGKQAFLGAKIWEEETNKKGGLIGRLVKLIYYDDQSNPSTVPSIYTKLLDVDKVDLVVGPYATAMIAPAMPVVIAKNKVFIGLFGLEVNSKFNYPKYFSMLPTGPDTKPSFTEGFFEVAVKQNPKPQTAALAFTDAEFAQNACEGARVNAKKHNIKIVYDKAYPPTTTEFTPIVRAVQAANPDLFVICSYPLDSVGMVMAVNEIGYKPKMVGGAMVGLQATVFKSKLGPALNGIINYETWVPSQATRATNEFLKIYQSRAAAEGVDPLGYYLGTWGYAYLEMLGNAIAATKSINDDKIADYLRNNTNKTIMGDVTFGNEGEWNKARMLHVQYHGIKRGAGLETWKGMDYQTVLTPSDLKTGNVIYPYEKALQQ